MHPVKGDGLAIAQGNQCVPRGIRDGAATGRADEDGGVAAALVQRRGGDEDRRPGRGVVADRPRNEVVRGVGLESPLTHR